MAASDIAGKIPPPVKIHSYAADDIPDSKPRARVAETKTIALGIIISSHVATFLILFFVGFNVLGFYLDPLVLAALVVGTMGLSISNVVEKIKSMVVS